MTPLNLKWKDLKSDFGPQNEHIRKRMAGRAQKNNPFCLVGPARPGPFKMGQKRAGPKRAGLARFDTPRRDTHFLNIRDIILVGDDKVMLLS